MTIESLIGWSLAYCAHPYAAWRTLTPRGRALLVAAYFGVSYVAALLTLVVSGR
ncbi:MAG: hypothetical protein ACRD1U_12110 [Vicinamibacterales bacterium]